MVHKKEREKTTGKPITSIICFWPVLLKVFFFLTKAIISSLNNKNQVTILRCDSKRVFRILGRLLVGDDIPQIMFWV